MGWVLDLDGVMWLAHEPIPGSAAAVTRLQRSGHDVVFVTNNASATVASVEDRLSAMGLDAAGRVLTSAQAAARLVDAGQRVLVCAGRGAVDAVVERGAVVLDESDEPESAEVVVVGMSPQLTYDRLARACLAVRAGARLVATNDDSTYPTPRGLLPGGGAILAAIVTATGAVPEIAGKPNAPMVDLVRDRLGPDGIVVGDRPETDGRFATALSYRFALVLSGVTSAVDLPVVPEPGLVASDLHGVVESVLGG